MQSMHNKMPKRQWSRSEAAGVQAGQGSGSDSGMLNRRGAWLWQGSQAAGREGVAWEGTTCGPCCGEAAALMLIEIDSGTAKRAVHCQEPGLF